MMKDMRLEKKQKLRLSNTWNAITIASVGILQLTIRSQQSSKQWDLWRKMVSGILIQDQVKSLTTTSPGLLFLMIKSKKIIDKNSGNL